jgi:tRNA pseudouridine55 synthase
LDIDGQVTHTSAERPSKSETTEAIKSFCGMISQIPPAFSALKINGQRAYTLAREGKDVELQARDVHIDKLELLEFSEEKAKFKVICGKGFYVRALARDICAKLGVYGYVSSLRRTESYPFKSEDMILLDLLEKVVHNTKPMVLDGLIKPVHAVLDDILVQRITEEEAFAIRLGRSIRTSSKDTIVTAMLNDKVVALCEARDGYLHPKRVFNY